MDKISLFDRWTCLGVAGYSKHTNPFEDPERLIVDTLKHFFIQNPEPRVLGFLVSWLAKYGHLIITRKFSELTNEEKHLLSACIEESGSASLQLEKLILEPAIYSPKILISSGVDVLDQLAVKDPLPSFLKHGFFVRKPKRDETLVRKKIILKSQEVFKRSILLKNRAIFGPSIRTDVGSFLPKIKSMSGHALSKKFYVTPQTLQPMLKDLVESGLILWEAHGRGSKINVNL